MQNTNAPEYNIAVVNNVQQEHISQRNQTSSTNNAGEKSISNNNTAERSIPQPLIVDETKQYIDGLVTEDDDDEMDSTTKQQVQNINGDIINKKINSKKTRGRVKIKMEFIQNKLRRYTTFSKRKTGIMKKAYELSTLTGTQVMLLVASETGHVYTFATRKLQPMITSESGKALIQTCLNSPDPSPATVQQIQQTQQNEVSMPHDGTTPTQVGISVADMSKSTLTQANVEDAEMHYQSENGEIIKSTITTSGTIGAISYVNQSGHPFPMTAYITSTGTQNQTALFTQSQNPAGNQTSQAVPVQLQPTQTVVAHHQPPQILAGQLQLHRIHPQNILLTGGSSVLQSNHIILNQAGNNTQPVVLDSPESVQTTRHTTGTQDVIALVNPELSSASRLQMVYSPGGNTVIYAPASSSTIKRTDTRQTPSEIVSLQHTPVIQTSAISQSQDPPTS